MTPDYAKQIKKAKRPKWRTRLARIAHRLRAICTGPKRWRKGTPGSFGGRPDRYSPKRYNTIKRKNPARGTCNAALVPQGVPKHYQFAINWRPVLGRQMTKLAQSVSVLRNKKWAKNQLA